MTRYINVHLDTTVRLALPDDHPYFGTWDDPEEFIEAETKLIEQAQDTVAVVYRDNSTVEGYEAAAAAIVFSDANVEDVTALVAP